MVDAEARIRSTYLKMYPLDENGVPLADRPFYHRFAIDGGSWVILRTTGGRWSAKFYPDD